MPQAQVSRRRELMFEVRSLNMDGTEQSEERWIEGKAVSFDSPTVLFEIDGIEYKEQIDSRAFEEADMHDVIFNYNHGGKVMARTRNKTLLLEVREDGLYIKARLDGTEAGRRMYDEIKGGYVDRMSFRFSIREESFDQENHMWTVRKIKRLYDVSAVDIPAYDDTSVEARRNSILEAEKLAAQEKSERKAAAELQRRRLALKIKLSMKNGGI